MKNERKLLKCDTRWCPYGIEIHSFTGFTIFPFPTIPHCPSPQRTYKDLLRLPTAWLPRLPGIKTRFEVGPNCSGIFNENTQQNSCFYLCFQSSFCSSPREDLLTKGKEMKKNSLLSEKYMGMQRQKRKYCILRKGEKLATKIYLRIQRSLDPTSCCKQI